LDRQRRERLWQVIAAASGAPGDDRWAQAVCVACTEEHAGADAAILALRGTARAQEVVGASDGWAAQLAESQYTVGEGPGVDAFSSGAPVLVPDVRVEQERWPGFVQEALTAGVGAMFAFPLQVGAIRMGTLEFLRRHSGGLTRAEVTFAGLLAELTTAGLLRQAGAAEEAGHEYAPPTVTSFHDVNVATGMLAARLRIGLDDAFARLRAHAFATGRSVLEVACEVQARGSALGELAD
jgi:hypothetical protein